MLIKVLIPTLPEILTRGMFINAHVPSSSKNVSLLVEDPLILLSGDDCGIEREL